MTRDVDEGKPRFDLLIPEGVPYDEQLLTRFAWLLARGAAKYSARNWEKASGQEELDRFRASALRHMMQWVMGETDEDHAAAAMFNLLGAETVKYKMRESIGDNPQDDDGGEVRTSKENCTCEENREPDPCCHEA